MGPPRSAEFCRVLASSAVIGACSYRVLLCPAEVCCSLRTMFESGGHGPTEFCRVLTIVSVAIEAFILHAGAQMPMLRLPGPVFDDDCTQCLVFQGERTPSFGGSGLILDIF